MSTNNFFQVQNKNYYGQENWLIFNDNINNDNFIDIVYFILDNKQNEIDYIFNDNNPSNIKRAKIIKGIIDLKYSREEYQIMGMVDIFNYLMLPFSIIDFIDEYKDSANILDFVMLSKILPEERSSELVNIITQKVKSLSINLISTLESYNMIDLNTAIFIDYDRLNVDFINNFQKKINPYFILTSGIDDVNVVQYLFEIFIQNREGNRTFHEEANTILQLYTKILYNSESEIISNYFINAGKRRPFPWASILNKIAIKEDKLKKFHENGADLNWLSISIHQVLSNKFLNEFRDYIVFDRPEISWNENLEPAYYTQSNKQEWFKHFKPDEKVTWNDFLNKFSNQPDYVRTIASMYNATKKFDFSKVALHNTLHDLNSRIDNI